MALAKKTNWLMTTVISPLIGLAPFRDTVLGLLTNKAPAGSISVSAANDLVDDPGSVGSRGGELWKRDPLAPKPGARLDYRVCDEVALVLSRLPGTPKCELYWPEAERDRAIAACAEFLRRYGERFRHDPAFARKEDAYLKSARMTFPLLAHPATLEDVAAGRAIFALEGERRLVTLPRRPMKAAWLKLEDDPQEMFHRDESDGPDRSRIAFNRGGEVWQAEEVRRGETWERWLGFVSRYQLTRVLADEIEFPAEDDRWAPLGSRLDCRLANDTAPGASPLMRVPAGQPLIVTLAVRNRRALPTGVRTPTAFPKAARALPKGVALTVWHTSAPPYREHGLVFPPAGDVDWKPQPGEPAGDLPLTELRSLEPAEEIELTRIDLREFFDLKAPGIYKVVADFRAPEWPKGATQELIFQVAP